MTSDETQGEPGARGLGPRSTALSSLWPAALLALAVAASGIGGDFVFDDPPIVRDNPRLESLRTLPGLFVDTYWGQAARGGLYRPVTLLSFGLERQLLQSGDGAYSAAGHHVGNAILYSACAALVSLLTLRLSGSRSAGLVAGLLFAAHPIHSEAVFALVGRSELLAAGFGLAALLAIYDAPKTNRRRAFLAGAFTLAALMSKESAVALLPLLVLLPAGPSERAERRPSLIELVQRRGEVWRWILAAFVLWAALRGIALSDRPGAPVTWLNNPLAARPAGERMAGAFELTLHYLRMSVFAHPLSADYSHAAMDPTGRWLALGPVLGLTAWAAMGGAVVGLRKAAARSDRGAARSTHADAAAFAVAQYALPLFVVSNVVFATGTIFAERLLFAPSVGLCMAAGLAFAGAIERRPSLRWPLVAAVSGACIAGAALFVQRSFDWRDELTLARSITRSQPASAKGHEKLGHQLLQRAADESPTARRETLAEAQRHLEQALAIYPGYGNAHLHLSRLHRARGDSNAWLREAEAAYRALPDSIGPATNLAQAANDAGHYTRALEVADAGLAHFPDAVRLLWARAEALVELGRHREALPVLRTLVEFAPGDATPIPHYIRALEATGQQEAARAERRRLAQVCRHTPDRPQCRAHTDPAVDPLQ